MSKDSLLVVLPGDRLYPDDCRIQTFSYGDATALSLLPKTQDTRKLFELVNDKVTLNAYDFTLQDFWFTMHWQRINSYSTFPVKIPWTCPHCDTKNIDELTSDKLIIEDVDPEYFHGMEVDFPDSGPLKFRLKLVRDEITVKRFMRDNGIDSKNLEVFEELLSAQMLEPNGNSLAVRYEIVKDMSADDQFLLKALESEFDYGVKDYSELTCEECKEVVKVNFQFDLTNFFPSVQDKSNIRSRILSRKTSSSTSGVDTEPRSDESDLYKGHPHKEFKTATRETKPAPSTDEDRGETLMSPEELEILIQRGVQEALTEEKKSSSLDEVTKNR